VKTNESRILFEAGELAEMLHAAPCHWQVKHRKRNLLHFAFCCAIFWV
jgi:hypothetical protein